MFEQQPKSIQQKVRSLATESIRQQNPSGWFETLYAEANGDDNLVPWAKNAAHPYLRDWLNNNPIQNDRGSALVVGCGLGDDAELLASIGYQVTAFDISATAINWCQQRFPNSSVNYLVADLFADRAAWQHKFDLVYECRTIQALPINVRSQVIEKIASFVGKQGTLLVITRYRENNILPESPPWAMSEVELSQFLELGLSEIQRDCYIEGEQNSIKQLRLVYRRINQS